MEGLRCAVTRKQHELLTELCGVANFNAGVNHSGKTFKGDSDLSRSRIQGKLDLPMK
jgi:hypothetical protein